MKICMYKIHWEKNQTLEAPPFTALTIEKQNHVPVLWAITDETAEAVIHNIHAYCAGATVPENAGTYIGAAHADGYLYHFFKEEQEQ